jgi:penicillin amidase
LAGWDPAHKFRLSTADQLTVQRNPVDGVALTANNDTMGESGDFYIHNFPTNSARADRITELLGQKSKFTVDDFCQMQLDLTDLRAKAVLPDLLAVLRSSDQQELRLALDLLEAWDCEASVDSAAACIYYPFLDRYWPGRFMSGALKDELISLLPAAAPGLNRFDIATFLKPDSPWAPYRELLHTTICEQMSAVVSLVKQALGDDPSSWRWGDLHQVAFAHRLNKQPAWAGMTVGPDEIGGSPTTLAMAMHIGKGPGQSQTGEVPCRVYHGPAYRLVVDLGDTSRARFVIAGGNGGRAGSPMAANHYSAWLTGEYFVLQLDREDIDTVETWSFEP